MSIQIAIESSLLEILYPYTYETLSLINSIKKIDETSEIRKQMDEYLEREKMRLLKDNHEESDDVNKMFKKIDELHQDIMKQDNCKEIKSSVLSWLKAKAEDAINIDRGILSKRVNMLDRLLEEVKGFNC